MLDNGWRRSARMWALQWAALGAVLLGVCAQAEGGAPAQGGSAAQGATAAQAPSTSVEVKLHDVPVKVTASTVLPDAKNPGRYGPANLLDEDPNTIWAEGAKSTGEGEWVELSFPPRTPVHAFLVTPGNPKSASLYQANARPKKAKLEVKIAEGGQMAYDLDFPKNFPVGGAIYVEYGRQWAVESARLTVVSVWPGSKYKDLCLGSFVPVIRGPNQGSLETFLGKGMALAPTIAAFMSSPVNVTELLPPKESGTTAWLRTYSEVPLNGALPTPVEEVDLGRQRLSYWGDERRALSEDVAGAFLRGALFRLTPLPQGDGYVFTPLVPPKKTDTSAHFQVQWRKVAGEWRVVELDVKYREETPP
jgi:hypothetical protein